LTKTAASAINSAKHSQDVVRLIRLEASESQLLTHDQSLPTRCWRRISGHVAGGLDWGSWFSCCRWRCDLHALKF